MINDPSLLDLLHRISVQHILILNKQEKNSSELVILRCITKQRIFVPCLQNLNVSGEVTKHISYQRSSRGVFCCACANENLFGAFGATLIFSARFCGFSTERSTPFCDIFWRGMKEYDKFTTISAIRNEVWVEVYYKTPRLKFSNFLWFLKYEMSDATNG